MSTLARQGHRLLQAGAGLLLFASLEGFAIPYVATPSLGVAVHTLSALESVLLLALGLTWPRFNLGSVLSRLAFWLLLYSMFSNVTAYLLAAVWGVGHETMPVAAGGASGTVMQRVVIDILAQSSAATGIAAFVVIIWGLRLPRASSSSDLPRGDS